MQKMGTDAAAAEVLTGGGGSKLDFISLFLKSTLGMSEKQRQRFM